MFKIFITTNQRDSAFIKGNTEAAHRGLWMIPREELPKGFAVGSEIEFWDHNEGFLGVRGKVTEINVQRTDDSKWCSGIHNFAFRWE